MPDFLQEPIGIGGAGKVAQTLGRLLVAAGAPVVAIASRDAQHARRASAFIGGEARAVHWSELPGRAKNLLLAVSDSAIAEAAATLAGAGLDGGIVLHTCGALGPEVLEAAARCGASCGVLHPLQTIMSPEQGVRDVPGIAFGIAGDGPAVRWAEWLARLAGGVPLPIPPGAMSIYHAAAVMASNYVIALIDAAADALGHAGIPPEDARRALGPLARASLENALMCGPGRALTGPISRGDIPTVSTHLEALEKCAPSVTPLYRAAGLHLIEVVRRRGAIPETVMAQMETLLAEGGRR